jgi:hypothetical protein
MAGQERFGKALGPVPVHEKHPAKGKPNNMRPLCNSAVTRTCAGAHHKCVVTGL